MMSLEFADMPVYLSDLNFVCDTSAHGHEVLAADAWPTTWML